MIDYILDDKFKLFFIEQSEQFFFKKIIKLAYVKVLIKFSQLVKCMEV